MYYYAMIDPRTKICYDVVQLETATDNAYYIQLDSFD